MSESLRFAVLGDPVGHSLSPRIHMAALDASGIGGSYQAIRADRNRLAEAVDQMRSGFFAGLNVTMPLKRAAAEFCDHLTEEAHVASSVNSLRAGGGKIEGHSTDSVAVASLLGSGGFGTEAPVVVLGGGATAEVVAHACANRMLYLSARREEQAADLAERLGSEPAVVAFGVPVAGAIVINATTVGMRGESLPEGLLEAASGLIDLPYRDKPTPAVEMAGRMGIPVVDGIQFLVTQAAASFSWWTGREAPFDVMLSAGRNS